MVRQVQELKKFRLDPSHHQSFKRLGRKHARESRIFQELFRRKPSSFLRPISALYCRNTSWSTHFPTHGVERTAEETDVVPPEATGNPARTRFLFLLTGNKSEEDRRTGPVTARFSSGYGEKIVGHHPRGGDRRRFTGRAPGSSPKRKRRVFPSVSISTTVSF